MGRKYVDVLGRSKRSIVIWGLAERALSWFVSRRLNALGSQAFPLSPDSLVKPEHHCKGTCSPGQALSALPG